MCPCRPRVSKAHSCSLDEHENKPTGVVRTVRSLREGNERRKEIRINFWAVVGCCVISHHEEAVRSVAFGEKNARATFWDWSVILWIVWLWWRIAISTANIPWPSWRYGRVRWVAPSGRVPDRAVPQRHHHIRFVRTCSVLRKHRSKTVSTGSNVHLTTRHMLFFMTPFLCTISKWYLQWTGVHSHLLVEGSNLIVSYCKSRIFRMH